MKNRINIFIVIVCMAMFSNCSKVGIVGSGAQLTQDRTVASFTNVTLDGSADVNITNGSVLKVTVRGFENLVPLFTTTVVGNSLVLKYKDNTTITQNDNIVVDVVMPIYNEINLNGSGDININSAFPNLNSVKYSIDGSGNITATNSMAKFITTSLDGSGDINCFGVVADSIDASLNGSGDINVSPVKFLKAFLDGSGNITYENNPILLQSKMGTGNIRKK
jgi:Putative auto-transporter adhesin, head GIN domain